MVLTAADTFDEMLAAYRGNMQLPDGSALRELIQRVLQKPGDGKSRPTGNHHSWRSLPGPNTSSC